MAIRITRDMQCTQAQLWSCFAELDKLKAWVPGLEGVELTSPEPHGVGSTYVMHMRERGKLQAYHGETLIWDPPRRIKEHLWGGRLKAGDRMTVDYRLVDRGDHVRFEYENQFQFRGWHMRLLRPLYFVMGHLFCRSMIRALKRTAEAPVVEAEPPTAP